MGKFDISERNISKYKNKLINSIDKISSYIEDYIIKSNLHDVFCKQHSNRKYNLKDYIKGFMIFIESYSYNNYDKHIKNYKENLPKKTSMFNFIEKLTKNKILENIYNKGISDIKKDSNILLIDSSFVQNKNNIKDVGLNKYYYNKNGIKLSVISSDSGIPLYIQSDPANRNDASITNDFIDNIPINDLNNKIILGDMGYDSKELKDKFKKRKCTLLTPINPRNKKFISEKKKERKQKNKLAYEIKQKKSLKKSLKKKQLSNKITEYRNDKLIDTINLNNHFFKNCITKNSYKKNNTPTKQTKVKIINRFNKLYTKRCRIEHLFSKIKRRKLAVLNERNIDKYLSFVYFKFITLYFHLFS
jgi:hypothetical protein